MASTHIRIGVLQREFNDMLEEMQQAEKEYKMHRANGNEEITQFWYGKFTALKSRTDRLAERFGFSTAAS